MNTETPDRFFDLAMQKIAGHASPAELAELEGLIAADAALQEEYDRLKAESQLMTELMPMVSAIREEKESLAEQPDRFFALAMQKIAGQASDAELAELDGLLVADATLQEEYDRLATESQLLKEALPLAAATRATEGEFPEWARPNLQREVKEVFGPPPPPPWFSFWSRGLRTAAAGSQRGIRAKGPEPPWFSSWSWGLRRLRTAAAYCLVSGGLSIYLYQKISGPGSEGFNEQARIKQLVAKKSELSEEVLTLTGKETSLLATIEILNSQYKEYTGDIEKKMADARAAASFDTTRLLLNVLNGPAGSDQDDVKRAFRTSYNALQGKVEQMEGEEKLSLKIKKSAAESAHAAKLSELEGYIVKKNTHQDTIAALEKQQDIAANTSTNLAARTLAQKNVKPIYKASHYASNEILRLGKEIVKAEAELEENHAKVAQAESDLLKLDARINDHVGELKEFDESLEKWVGNVRARDKEKAELLEAQDELERVQTMLEGKDMQVQADIYTSFRLERNIVEMDEAIAANELSIAEIVREIAETKVGVGQLVRLLEGLDADLGPFQEQLDALEKEEDASISKPTVFFVADPKGGLKPIGRRANKGAGKGLELPPGILKDGNPVPIPALPGTNTPRIPAQQAYGLQTADMKKDRAIKLLKNYLAIIRLLNEELKKLQRENQNLKNKRENYKDRLVIFTKVRNDRENPGKEKK